MFLKFLQYSQENICVGTHAVIRCTTRCHSLSLVIHCHSLSFFVTRFYSFSLVVPLVVTRCTTRCHSLSFVVPLVVIHCHLLPFVVTSCTTLFHWLSLVLTRCTTRLSFYKFYYVYKLVYFIYFPIITIAICPFVYILYSPLQRKKVILIVYKKTGDWYDEWQWITTSDNRWQRVTTNDNERQRVVILANFLFSRIREEPTTMHLKETLWALRRILERLLN